MDGNGPQGAYASWGFLGGFWGGVGVGGYNLDWSTANWIFFVFVLIRRENLGHNIWNWNEENNAGQRRRRSLTSHPEIIMISSQFTPKVTSSFRKLGLLRWRQIWYAILHHCRKPGLVLFYEWWIHWYLLPSNGRPCHYSARHHKLYCRWTKICLQWINN